MMNYICLLILLVTSCATKTPLKQIPEDAEIRQVVFMNPSPKFCKYKRTVDIANQWDGKLEGSMMDDLNHLAYESTSNVARMIKRTGVTAKVELYSCPEKYVKSYLKKHFK